MFDAVIKITTTTGQGNKYAGSGGNKVYILINGDPELKHRLTNKNKPFQRGATDKFEKAVASAVGAAAATLFFWLVLMRFQIIWIGIIVFTVLNEFC